jgi:hypothetical protein
MGSVLVNTVPFDFQSFESELIVGGAANDTYGIVSGLEKFDWSIAINRTKFYGRSRLPHRHHRGRRGLRRLDLGRAVLVPLHGSPSRKSLASPWPTLELVLNLTASGKLPGDELDIHTIDVTGVKIKGLKESGQHGPDQQMIDIPLDVMNIYFDGVDIFGNKL